MPDLSKIEIKKESYKVTVTVDGQEIRNITKIIYRHDVGDLPRLTLEIIADDVFIEHDGAEVEKTEKKFDKEIPHGS